MDNVEIRRSPVSGKGLFTTKAHKKDDLVYTYTVEKVVRSDEIILLTAEQKDHLNQIGRDKYELIDAPGCYVNHSCDPNVMEKDRNGYALRNIAAGEELTVDYDRDAYLQEPFQCYCGAKNCRGQVQGRKHL